MSSAITRVSDESANPAEAIEQMVQVFQRLLAEQTQFNQVNAGVALGLLREAIVTARSVENLMCELVASAAAERSQRSGRVDTAMTQHSIGAAIAERRRLMTRAG